MLVLGLFIRKDALNTHTLAVIGMQFFGEPDAHMRSYPLGEAVHGKGDPFHFGIPVDLAQRKIVCAQRLFNVLNQGHHILTDGAGKEVNGAIIVFRPGMQTCMRLCEQQKTGKAMGAKLVKALVHNRQAAFTDGLRKQRVCLLAIHENLMVAVGEVKDKVLSQFQSRVHLHLLGLKIERTHPKTRTFHFKTIRKMCALRNE
jgi:hypothetical protein